MVRQPKVFLMDEPISALDAKLRAEMRAEIKWRQRQTGITTLYVTHDQTEAMSMADRIAILKDGDVMQVGTATEVYHSPANLFVADFIGNPSINLIPCKVSAFEDEYMQISLLDHLQYQITEAEIVKQLARMDRDCELILGIHPEDISLEDIGLEDRQNMDDISAEIYESEPLGAETIVDLNLGKSERGEMVILKVRTSPDFDKAVGQMVAIKFDQKQLFFFDAITGEAIR
jgi:ABC-type sugar transport system ATPase subunit